MKKRLLLHACCAPCASHVINELKEEYDVTIYFYNPNITDQEEFDKRFDELKRFVNEFDSKIKVLSETDYDKKDFYAIASGLVNEPERGKRCTLCYNLRLEKTAMKASELCFDIFTTTLTVSPYKDAERVNNLGNTLSKKYNIEFLEADFKKKDGYKKSIEFSKEYNLYRQNYCGCEFSK